MQIKKTYDQVNPELLFQEIRDFIRKQEVIPDEKKLETYSMPDDSSSFVTRGILTFRVKDKQGKKETECISVHLVGSARGETKVMFDIDEKLFPKEKVDALISDLDFIFSSFEVLPE